MLTAMSISIAISITISISMTTLNLQPTTYNKDFTPFSSRDKMPHDLEVRILRFRQA